MARFSVRLRLAHILFGKPVTTFRDMRGQLSEM